MEELSEGFVRRALMVSLRRKEKKMLSVIIDTLESLAEPWVLSEQELQMKKQANEEIAQLLREEDLKWYQRSKAQFILEGGDNTR